MSENDIKNTSQTDWAALEALTDEEIDYSDIPPLTDEFFARAKLAIPNAVAIEPELLAWFKARDREFPALINRVLRDYVEAQK